MRKFMQTPNPYYCIEDTRLSTKSGWHYDNRNVLSDGDGVVADPICAENLPGVVCVNRYFTAQSKGKMTFEMQIFIDYDKGGLFFNFTNKQEQNSLLLSTKDGYLYCKDAKADVKFENSLDGDTKLKICADLDERVANIYINGVFGAKVDMDNYPIEKLEIGILPGGCASFKRGLTKLYFNYSVNEDFIMTPTNALPCDYTFDGSFSIDKKEQTTYLDNYCMKISANANTSHKANKAFDAVGGKVIAECFMLLDKAQSGSYLSLNCGNDSVIKVETKDSTFVSHNGTHLRNYTDYIWQIVKICADTDSQKADIYIDGKNVGSVDFACPAEYFDSITVGFDAKQDAQMWFDDLKVYCYKEPEDYVPQPVVPKSLGYNIGLNVCPLWREGSHFGWYRVSSFPDVEPVLGYYEEGVRETADWEIKFLVEHGVNFQHICWYDNAASITEPIKVSHFDYSLNQGFFYAKYSHLMKFCLMWENTNPGSENLEQFKKYIWNYWKEYYFSDERYMAINNRAVITVYNYYYFLNAFGGYDKAKEAIAFMNEDIKTLGYDGMMLYFSLSGGSGERSKFYKDALDIGAQGVYAYHWFGDGAKAKTQIPRIARIKGYGGADLAATLSTGFNNLGWSDVRKDVITPEDFEKVALYIKNEYMTSYPQGSWQSNTMFLSNWNEYGEGTYLMPAGVHGFGYLDVIRKHFTDDSQVSHTDHIPTPSQKERITRMYDQTLCPIRAWDYEDDHEVKAKFLINGKPLTLRYEPVFENGECYAVCEPKAGFFTRQGLYYEYSRKTGVLLIKSKKHTVEFTVGTVKAIVDGKQYNLEKQITCHDGLPVLPIRFLCDSLEYGVKADPENKVCAVYVFGKDTIELTDARIVGKWDFSVFGDKEGWYGTQVKDGDCNDGYALTSDSGAIGAGGFDFDADMFLELKMRIKYNLAQSNTKIKVIFTSKGEDAQPEELDLGNSTSYGKYVEKSFELKPLLKNKSNITSIRLDFGNDSEFFADYIELTRNPDYVAPVKQERSATIINGDASDMSNVTFFSSRDVVTICEGPDNPFNYVFYIEAKKPFAYARHSVRYEEGVTYVAEFDVRVAGDKPTNVYYNAVYLERERQDHVVGKVRGCYDDGWLHFKGEFTVENLYRHDLDQFAVFSDPVDDEGSSFYLDNAKLYKKE